MDITHEGEVTRWLAQLKSGDAVAAQRLWDRYFDALRQVARRRVQSLNLQDDEDLALSVLHQVFANLKAEKYPALQNRDEFWRLLFTATVKKAIDYHRRESAAKRGPGQRFHAGPGKHGDAEEGDVVDRAESREPSPDFLAILAEQRRRWSDLIPDVASREVYRLLLDGHRAAEIAVLIGSTENAVQRKIKAIRATLKRDMEDNESDRVAR
jgi:DNA-directed RNA polymerase specialized sigma24 family protein